MKTNMKFTMYNGFGDMVVRKGIDQTAAYVRKLGFSSVEASADLYFGTKNPFNCVSDAQTARVVLEENQLSVSCYTAYTDLWGDPTCEASMCKHIEIASALGSPYFHHTLAPRLTAASDPEYQMVIKKLVEVASRIADYADTLGVTCIYEDQGFYVNGVEGFGGFWREMKQRCRNIGVCGDMGNILFVNETPKAFFENYIEDICHVHVKDYLWKKAKQSPGLYWEEAAEDSWLRDTMIGHGVVDIESCLKILKDAGYSGSFALELSHPEPYEEGVAQAMEYLKRFW